MPHSLFVPSALGTPEKGKITKSPLSKESDVSPASLAQFFQALDNRKAYYGILLQLSLKPEGMGDEELVKQAHIEGGQALGGALGGLSKRAEKAGLSLRDMVTVTEETTDGVTTRHYALTNKMKEVMGVK